ncbi:hypothetical protein PLEOSDRAFT_1109427 [Pleurotus ostreatus PC15]|uniref:F-box domain-containing protein n=1 Tax=Pleurotus ostreatus (strain PC15) TaxID=1137138 RepID=A0A067N2W3_PLEO1|nr:hypothetical protein PLEOSDRAFT_1109427 [Pleurotus ostreatus PC15]
MILADLDWKDVLNVRGTCKLLCTASRSRSVWRAQYQRMSDSYDTPLNAKDRTANYAELERDTLHWARVQRNWAHQSKRPTRRLVGRCHGLEAHLIQGGRWLLTNPDCWDPCLSVYDLDKNGQHRVLIRPQDKREKRIEAFVVDEVNTLPKIEVCIALVRERPHEHLARLSFWKVTNSPEDTLVARHITSFNTYAHDISHVKDLRGDYFARFALPYTNGPQWIDVYNWRRSCSLIHHKATFVIRERLYTIRILPGQRIIGLDRQSVRIYDVPRCRSVAAKCPVAGLPTAPLHVLALPGLNPDIYTPFTSTFSGPLTSTLPAPKLWLSYRSHKIDDQRRAKIIYTIPWVTDVTTPSASTARTSGGFPQGGYPRFSVTMMNNAPKLGRYLRRMMMVGVSSLTTSLVE